ncbi:MAG: DsbA family oxidoreductase, partial [Parvularculaceae bacterium]
GTFVTDLSPLAVDIVADPVCPWCYVGTMSLLAARDRLANEIPLALRWRPYMLNPATPAEGVDRHAYYREKFPDAEGLAKARETIRAYAKESGFDFDPAAPAHLPNTLKAHMVIRLALGAGNQEEVARAIYRAFWDELRDIGDDETLIDIAAKAGLPADAVKEMLSSDEEKKSVASEAIAFAKAGVTGVPTFIVGEAVGFTGGMPPDAIVERLRRARDVVKELTA